jgi:hypothetical protein
MRNRRCGAARQSRHSLHLQNPGGAELVECDTPDRHQLWLLAVWMSTTSSSVPRSDDICRSELLR